MSHKTMHQHAFWLYGVLVGLAIKEALAGSAPHIINLYRGTDGLSGAWEPEAARLFIFLISIIRFYLGSALFFNETYLTADPEAHPHAARSYAVDFLFGLTHFLFFFGLALSIEIHNAPVNAYRIFLVFILLYDILWLMAAHYRRRILRWAVMNTIMVALAGAVFYTGRRFNVDSMASETMALVVIAFMSFIDIGETIIGRAIVAKWITDLGDKMRRVGNWLSSAETDNDPSDPGGKPPLTT